MAKEYKQNAIGLEITDDNIFLSQLDLSDEKPVVTQVKSVTIPPRSIMDGQITDVDTIAEQIIKALDESEFSSDNIIVALNDISFFKRLSKMAVSTPADLILELEMKVSQEFYFSQKEFHLGHQRYKETKVETDDDEKKEDKEKELEWESILYAALPNDLIDNIEELVKSLDKNLVSIDLVPLGALRAMMWGDAYKDSNIILCYVDTNYIDINFVYDGQVVLSHVFRRQLTDILDEPFFMDGYMTVMRQLMCQFTNLYPHYEIPKRCCFYSRLPRVEAFFSQMATELFIEIEPYDISSNILFLTDEKDKTKLDQYARSYLPAIGLGLKYFEPINKTLSITKVKKQIAPIFNQKMVMIFGGILAAFLMISFGINYYVSNLTSTLDMSVRTTKNRIKAIQTGEFVGRQKKIDTLKESIKFFGKIKEVKKSKYLFFHDLTEQIPSDMSFSALKISQKQGSYFVFISGQSYFQESIYSFYTALQQQYSNVNLASIRTKYDQDGVGINEFQVNFLWK